MTALSSPYIAQERTAQSAILSVRSERFALCLKERHRSQNQDSLKSEERKSDFKERCAQLWDIVKKERGELSDTQVNIDYKEMGRLRDTLYNIHSYIYLQKS